MPLLNVFDIAGSGMSANALRLNITASNMANADSVSSSSGATYRERLPVFSTVMQDAMSGGSANNFGHSPSAGVRVSGIIESQAPLRSRYQPDHPMADEDGNIFLPNVNMMEQMAHMISASRAYQSNVEIINTSKQMLMGTLQMGQ